MSLSNQEIELIARKNGIILDGVLSQDSINQIQEKSDRDYFYIYNTAKMNDNNDIQHHWIALCFVQDPASVYIYDSLGQPIQQHVLDVIRSKSKNIFKDWIPKLKTNSVQQQHDRSKNCGYYALHFIKQIQLGKSFKDASGFLSLDNKIQEQLKSKDRFNVIF